MTDDKFDAIVVGAGPAGTAAALTMGRAGLNVLLLERGEYPGAKNVQGAVLYTKMLDDLVPGFWREPNVPMERHITEQTYWLMAEDGGFHLGFKSERWAKEPHNCYTILRANFDRWFAKKAEEAGAQLFTGVTVSGCLKENGRIVGIKTSEGDEMRADVVVAADGVNSMLAQDAGLIDEWRPDEVALGVKEILALPREKIEDRFCLEKNEGTTQEMFGRVTRGMLGYSFLYTNRDTLSLGVGVKLSHLQKTGIKPYDLLESVKRHPLVRRKIEGAKPLEYSAHLIPEGGWHSLPPLYADGFLIAGDAAQMINAAHREGSNLAMAAGRMAGETVALAKKDGDFSKGSLARYQKKLQESFILPDLYLHRDLETIAEKHLDLLDEGSVLAAQSAFSFLTVDGRPKEAVHEEILDRILRSPAVRRAVRSELSFKNAFRSVPLAWKGLKMFFKLFI